jgi:hypothetical protein
MKKAGNKLHLNQTSPKLLPRTAGAPSKETFEMTKPQSSPSIDPEALKATQEALKNAPSGDAPGVDKIRELLFGNQMQDYDKRFSQIQDRFVQKIREMEAESARSLQTMEGSIKKQLESIAGQVRHEQDQRVDADKEMGRTLREQMDVLEKQLGKISDQLATLDREFTERMGHEIQGIRDEIRRRGDDTRATIEGMFAELSNVKTDRNLLAGLFVEVARCLNQDMSPNGTGTIRGNGHRS